MKTQVELQRVDALGRHVLVGFVEPNLAMEEMFVLGGVVWVVTRVYATEKKDYVAWWFKATKLA